VGCLPDGELVRTANGHKPIEEVEDDDLLLDKEGQFVKVEERMRRRYVGDILSIRPYGAILPTRLTPEHPVFVCDPHDENSGRWIKAGEVIEGDWMRLPVPRRRPMGGRELMDKWPEDAVRIDFRVDPAILWNVDFWWLVGIWLGDGWAREKDRMASISIALNLKKEMHIAEKVRSVVQRLTGRTPRFREKPYEGCIEVSWDSVQWARFLTENFGKYAGGKRVAEWVHRLPKDHRLALLQGYFDSDGGMVNCVSKDPKRKSYQAMGFTSISYDLMAGMQDLLFGVGCNGAGNILREEGITIFNGKPHKTKRTYQIRLNSAHAKNLLDLWEGNEYSRINRNACDRYTHNTGRFIYSRVQKIVREHYDGYVNNFETETHSYCAGLISTHNCDVGDGILGGDFSVIEIFKAGYMM
jgi:intein/homing endonuclease